MSSPIWASSLLNTADKLAAGSGAGRPALADLRRGTSTAYYALFHQIIRHASIACTPEATEADVANISRWFTHVGVLKASGWVLSASRSGKPKKEDVAAVGLLRRGPGHTIAPDLVLVASVFTDLQGARHDADYSIDYNPIRFTTKSHVDAATVAVKKTWSMWNALGSPRLARDLAAQDYRRFLLLALSASGGPRTR